MFPPCLIISLRQMIRNCLDEEKIQILWILKDCPPGWSYILLPPPMGTIPLLDIFPALDFIKPYIFHLSFLNLKYIPCNTYFLFNACVFISSRLWASWVNHLH